MLEATQRHIRGLLVLTAVAAVALSACGGGSGSVWFPDIRRSEPKASIGVMVKF